MGSGVGPPYLEAAMASPRHSADRTPAVSARPGRAQAGGLGVCGGGWQLDTRDGTSRLDPLQHTPQPEVRTPYISELAQNTRTHTRTALVLVAAGFSAFPCRCGWPDPAPPATVAGSFTSTSSSPSAATSPSPSNMALCSFACAKRYSFGSSDCGLFESLHDDCLCLPAASHPARQHTLFPSAAPPSPSSRASCPSDARPAGELCQSGRDAPRSASAEGQRTDSTLPGHLGALRTAGGVEIRHKYQSSFLPTTHLHKPLNRQTGKRHQQVQRKIGLGL